MVFSPNQPPAYADRIEEAALGLRFAYVATGDRALNEKTRAGLEGLSRVLYERTSVEPDPAHEVNLATDPINLYPLIYFSVPDDRRTLSSDEQQKLNAYLRRGGALIIDTREGGNLLNAAGESGAAIGQMLSELDIPPLRPVPYDHVLTRAFYLVDGFPGRYMDRPLWIEDTGGGASASSGDGVSGVFITDADLAAAWALDRNGRPLYSVDGGDRGRELAFRAGVNLVMYILTGNYKEDQVHLPALLERLGEAEENDELGSDNVPMDLLEQLDRDEPND